MKAPPSPFKPAIETLSAGHLLYRVFTSSRTPIEFNPGVGAPTRFGFFGRPAVPIMYAADMKKRPSLRRCCTTSRSKVVSCLTTITPAKHSPASR